MPRPRRPPPSALRLVAGVPPRGYHRHALPSVPCPAFHPDVPLAAPTNPIAHTLSQSPPAPMPRPRYNSVDAQPHIPMPTLPSQQHLPLAGVSLSDCEAFANPYPYVVPSRNSSTSSLASNSSTSVYDGTQRQRSNSGSGSPRIRGPWDHSGCIPLPFNMEDMLKAPEPVAISPGAGR